MIYVLLNTVYRELAFSSTTFACMVCYKLCFNRKFGQQMYPVCFKIGALTIHWYGVMMAFGFFAALANWSRLGKSQNRDFNYCSDLLFWLMISGILGARIAYVAANWTYFIEEPIRILRIDRGGLIYYGGFLAAGTAIVVFAKIKKEKISALFDFVIISLPLSHAFGRIGCFLNGCCHGSICKNFLGVRFPITSPAAWGQHANGLITNERVQRLITTVKEYRMTKHGLTEKVAELVQSGKIDVSDATALPVHPVQLYESAFNLAIYFFLFWAYRRRKTDGGILALYLLTYPVGRFFIEFMRGDERIPYMGLSVAQALSIALFIIGVMILLWSRKHQRTETIS
ncbi:MAG: prolipoprotein diacylglyceryl transferase [Kiritimatiellae bacterium]|nr:prolipoprotein diacylglyceryl transferase [Kiritimatiellia bacterium]